LRFICEQHLERHAAEMGERLLQHLRDLQGMAPCLGEVRGRGLMVGVEIVDVEVTPDALGAYPAAPVIARRIQVEALRRGLILELGGRHDSVVRFLPPLIVTAEQVDQIAEIFGEAVLDAQGRPADQIRARV
jgi:diaminobutyrate-2-oxoglutarate transaminase